jgi:hypothetical protein
MKKTIQIGTSDFKDGLMFLLSNLYKEHEYLLESDKLSKIDKQDYMDMMAKKASIAAVCNGISALVGYMNKHYGKKVMVFIDEYNDRYSGTRSIETD